MRVIESDVEASCSEVVGTKDNGSTHLHLEFNRGTLRKVWVYALMVVRESF